MAEVPIAALKAISRELDALGVPYVFTGGSIVALLVDEPEASVMRPTDDVDVIVEILTHTDYSKFEEQLRELGFDHDIREGAPKCRWIYRNLTVDTMPVRGAFLGLKTIWFDHALSNLTNLNVDGTTLSVISAISFIATKLAAFSDRGESDFFGSHDMEDILTVIDGRETILEEIENAPSDLRNYIINTLKGFVENSQFQEALPGHLPPDSGSQARLPILKDKISRIAELDTEG